MRQFVHVALLSALAFGSFAAWTHYRSLTYCERAEWHFWNRAPARACRERAAAERAALMPYIAAAKARGFTEHAAIGVAKAELSACRRTGVPCKPEKPR